LRTRRAFAEQLGPDRVAALRQAAHDNTRQRLERLRDTARWQNSRQQHVLAEAAADRALADQAAAKADQAEQTQLRDRAAGHDTAAADSGTRRDELLAEQQLRTTMPDTQLALEHQLRTQAARISCPYGPAVRDARR
jgi:hypothetical protein